MENHYDLIIAGAGLAGNCLALALRNSGLKIAIVEAGSRREMSDAAGGDRALALAAGTVRLLRGLDAWAGVADKAAPIKHIHVSDRGHFGKTRLSAAENGVDAFGYVIIARDIEDHLADLTAKTDVTHFYETRVAGLVSGYDEVNVSLKQHGKSLNLSARLLVGADGGQSTVRKLLEIPQQTVDYGQTAFVTTVKSSLAHHDTAYERFTPFGPLAMLPLPGRQSAVVWARSPEQAESLRTAGDDDFLSELQDCFGYRLGRLQLTAPRREFPLSLIRAGRMSSGRVVIIGNAVHQLHPVAGQGFNLGIRDVACLAELIKRRRPQADPGAAAMLSAYVRLRQPDHDKTIGFTDSLVRIFSNSLMPAAAARNAGLILLDRMPLAKKLLVKHAMGMAERFEKSG
ncbi:MAG: 2-octaprenyl-6-methoxyphenyl hydroxylase [Methylomonas sp.]|jgi:2-octaprenyl-6-methoxyphenol hydroxylase